MVTRSQWVAGVLKAWEGEPCPRCGRPLRPYMVDNDGDVWAHCSFDDFNTTLATERWPEHFEPEPDEGEELPF